MARIYICVNARGVEEDQCQFVSMHHYFFERHGDGWADPASPGAAFARSEEYGGVCWVSGTGDKGSHDQEWGPFCKDFWGGSCDPRASDGTRAVQRSCRS